MSEEATTNELKQLVHAVPTLLFIGARVPEILDVWLPLLKQLEQTLQQTTEILKQCPQPPNP